jgi:long-chain acyl-CoA synthetase
VLCEDAAQAAKVEEERASLPLLRHVLTFADLPALEAEGAAFKAGQPTALDDAVAAIGEEDLFTLIYTSGTTGPPKGCMIRHRNYYAMVSVIDHLPGYVRADDLMLLYLPLAHNFGRLMHLAGPYVGYTTAFLPDPLQTAAALTSVRPTVLPSVPRVYEKIHTAVVSAIDDTTGAKRRLADWSLAVGREVSKRDAAGLPVGGALRAKHRVADRLVFAKIRERLGGRLRTPISGGAPLAQEIAEFFDSIGIRILEAYGLTECTTGATTNTPEHWRFGTVGQAFPGFELRIADDGELLIKSDTVFGGYYKEPDATAEVLGADGWLRSGDIAEIDADGFVRITDRKKDIIVTAGGKNIAPQNIENDLKASKYISQALVVGDRRPYPAALLTLDAVEIGKWAEAQGLPADLATLVEDERVRALVQAVVDEVNRERSRFEQLKRFVILPRDFTLERDEVTPTLKLKRRTVMEHFSQAVDSLYES